MDITLYLKVPKPDQMVAIICATVSLAMAVCLGAAYPAFHHSHLRLTFEQPFGDWKAVRGFYLNAAGRGFTGNDTLIAQTLGGCNATFLRRPPACVCLDGVLAGFLNETLAPVSPAVAGSYGEQALACHRFRAAWDVWSCDSCILHPVALALALNASLALLMGAYALLSAGLSRPVVFGLAFVVVALASAPLLAFHWKANALFVLLLLAAFVAVVYSLEDDLQNDELTDDTVPLLSRPEWSPPSGLMVALWWDMPLLTALHVAHLGASHLVRDIPALLGFALLGFLAGLMAQRIHWTKWYLMPGADSGAGFRITSHLHSAFGAWTVYLLKVALAGTWVGIGVLAYTNYYRGPLSAWWAALVAVALIAVTHAIEAFGTFKGYLLPLLANVLVGVVALADSAL